MGENIPLPPVTPVGGGSTWEPERGEKETSFGGRESQRNRVLEIGLKDIRNIYIHI